MDRGIPALAAPAPQHDHDKRWQLPGIAACVSADKRPAQQLACLQVDTVAMLTHAVACEVWYTMMESGAQASTQPKLSCMCCGTSYTLT